MIFMLKQLVDNKRSLRNDDEYTKGEQRRLKYEFIFNFKDLTIILQSVTVRAILKLYNNKQDCD